MHHLQPLPLFLLAASPAGAGLPPTYRNVAAAPPVPPSTPVDRARLIEVALYDSGIVDEQPSAAWERDAFETRCVVTFYKDGGHLSSAVGSVEGHGEDADFRSWLQAVGRNLAGLASGKPCGCPECEDAEERERAERRG